MTFKTMLVTGASRGIGRAIALRLAAEGVLIAVHYGARQNAADETVAQIEKKGGSAFAIGADITNVDEIEQLFNELPKRFAKFGADGLDVLVNNAGIGIPGGLEDTDSDLFDKMFATNVKALYYAMRYASPLLKPGGRVVNVSSLVSLAPYPAGIVYAATKKAANSLTQSAAEIFGARKITVNAVAPGATNTDFLGDMKDNPEVIKAIEHQTTLGRLGEPEDIADVVAFLVSEQGRWITGQIINASGGMKL